MSRTAEEAMLVAAMEGDSEELKRLAKDATPVERQYLTKALNAVYDALAAAEKAAQDEFLVEYRAKRQRPPLGAASFVGDDLPDMDLI